MKTQYTKGPWLTMNGAHSGKTIWHEDSTDPRHRKVVCDVPVSNTMEQDSGLISAAPELAEACRAIIACDTPPEDMGGDWGTVEWAEQVGQAIQQARAALEKAGCL